MFQRSQLRALPMPLVCVALCLNACGADRRSAGGAGEGNPNGAGLQGPCDGGARRCVGTSLQTCDPEGLRWSVVEECNLRNLICDGGACVDRPVGGGEGEGEADGGGLGGEGEAGGGQGVGGAEGGELGEGGEAGQGGEGEGEGCANRTNECAANLLMYCIDGEWVEQEDCAASNRVCEDGECVGCDAGSLSCRGNRVVQCDDAGLREETVEICAEGSRCVDGACVTLCGAEGNDKASYQGCEYWAVDLDNADVDVPGGVSPAAAQFAVVVSNVNAEDVEVVAWDSDDGQAEREVLRTTVRGGEIEVLNLPPRSIVGSGMGFNAYRISASQAVIAYQFNPLNNTDTAFSNDASLLIPSNGLGDEYFAVTGDGIHQAGDFMNPEPTIWGSFVTIVGVGPDPVDVTVDASTDIQRPEGAQVAGRTVTATLGRYEVLSVHSLPEENNPLAPPEPGNGNLSGTRVRATGPVAVFSGNVAIVVPAQASLCCADHLEEQLWPVDSWGMKYVAARSLVRRPGNPETDFWRLTGSVDGTELTYRPQRPQGAPLTLQRGQSVEFDAPGHFVVEATQPVQLTQFLTASQWVDPGAQRGTTCQQPGTPAGDEECAQSLGYLAVCQEAVPGFPILGGTCAPISDPAMVLAPPSEQYRNSYVFLAPSDYNTDFINVVAPAGTVVELDGRAIAADAWQDAGDLDGQLWQVATVVVSDGRHVVESEVDFGLLVYGYDQDVSYGYPGGLDLEKFDAPPPRE